MNSRELIQETLTLSEGVPLFDFNVNFTALKKLLVDFNLNLNSQKEEIDELRLLLRGKADKEIVMADPYLGGRELRIAQRSTQPHKGLL